MSTADVQYLVTSAGTSVSFTCPGPLSAPPDPSAGSPDPGGGSALCARERDSNTPAARIAGELALLLWLYLAWTRRRAGRWRLTSIAKSVLTVAAASWAAFLGVLEVAWATDWSSTWLVAPLLLYTDQRFEAYRALGEHAGEQARASMRTGSTAEVGS